MYEQQYDVPAVTTTQYTEPTPVQEQYNPTPTPYGGIAAAGQAIGGGSYPTMQLPGGYYPGDPSPIRFVPDQPLHPCRENQHVFACKHEPLCNCKQTQRGGLKVDDGL